ncbi:MAG: type II secretion system secretin GspD [Pseudomonadota bacterium]
MTCTHSISITGDRAVFGLLVSFQLAMLVGCNEHRTLPRASMIAPSPEEQARPLPVVQSSAPARRIGPANTNQATPTFVRYGDTAPAAKQSQRSRSGSQGPRTTLNIENASIDEIAAKILGDLLGATYTIEVDLPDVATLRTPRPSTAREIIGLFEDLLTARGAVLLSDGNSFRILPADPDSAPLRTAPLDRGGGQALGYGSQAIKLAHIKPSRMAEILQPVIAEGAIRSLDDRRGLLVLAGSRRELDEVKAIIDLFDVDWLRSMSIGLLPLRRANPVDVAQEIMFTLSDETAEGASDTRVLPVERAKAVLVVSPSAAILNTIKDIVPYLDIANGDDRSVYVYQVQNRSAAELADLVGKVYGAAQGSGGQPPAADEDAGITQASLTVATGNGARGVSVVADDAGNALIVRADPDTYPEAISLIQSLDTLPSQVLLEMMIAEVTLADELRYGVEWFLRFGEFDGQFSANLTDFVNPTGAGLSLLLSGSNAGVVVNALSGLTDVNVVSNPSLMVLDNRSATLQVGDQVPVVLQSAVSVNDPDAPIVNSVQYRDTGVTLNITPRISDNGLVVLEIEQNVSDVVETTTSGIDSPTIQQRRIATTVAVNDGESLALGGLIRDEAGNIQTGVPLLRDIPVAGELFKNTEDVRQRTELIIIITPRVIRNPAEARLVTNELRDRLISLRPTGS